VPASKAFSTVTIGSRTYRTGSSPLDARLRAVPAAVPVRLTCAGPMKAQLEKFCIGQQVIVKGYASPRTVIGVVSTMKSRTDTYVTVMVDGSMYSVRLDRLTPVPLADPTQCSVIDVGRCVAGAPVSVQKCKSTIKRCLVMRNGVSVLLPNSAAHQTYTLDDLVFQ
jgi:hypothetical protein